MSAMTIAAITLVVIMGILMAVSAVMMGGRTVKEKVKRG